MDKITGSVRNSGKITTYDETHRKQAGEYSGRNAVNMNKNNIQKYVNYVNSNNDTYFQPGSDSGAIGSSSFFQRMKFLGNIKFTRGPPFVHISFKQYF